MDVLLDLNIPVPQIAILQLDAKRATLREAVGGEGEGGSLTDFA